MLSGPVIAEALGWAPEKIRNQTECSLREEGSERGKIECGRIPRAQLRKKLVLSGLEAGGGGI